MDVTAYTFYCAGCGIHALSIRGRAPLAALEFHESGSLPLLSGREPLSLNLEEGLAEGVAETGDYVRKAR